MINAEQRNDGIAGTWQNPIDRPCRNAPTDAFAAGGYRERYVVVIPSKKLVMVRAGATSVHGLAFSIA
jgi:hypothetical protein